MGDGSEGAAAFASVRQGAVTRKWARRRDGALQKEGILCLTVRRHLEIEPLTGNEVPSVAAQLQIKDTPRSSFHH